MPFKVKMTTAFEKLFKAYCSKKALDVNTLVFLTSEGQRIIGHQTPADVSDNIVKREPVLCLWLIAYPGLTIRHCVTSRRFEA